ncbi:ParB/RepB/Spo0J family partition protein [Oxalobacteraceae bacterium GrIS 1.11]
MASKLQQRLASRTADIERAPSEAIADAQGKARSMTMPGQLGAFRLEAQRYQEAIDELTGKLAQAQQDNLAVDELKKQLEQALQAQAASKAARPILLHLVDDSPYQPRIEYDPENIDHLAQTMESAGLSEPITVRPIGDRFELISGHRRVRAARSLGWTEIDALIVLLNDREAQKATMLHLIGGIELSDYELGKMCAHALNEGFVNTQKDAGQFFAKSQSMISGALDLLKLPPPIISMLERKPSLFGMSCGKFIKDLIADHPEHLELIVKGVERINDGIMAQASLKGWVAQMIVTAGRKIKQAPTDKKTFTAGRRTIYSTKVKPREITVGLKALEMSMGDFEERLNAWLEQDANNYASNQSKSKT